MRHNLSEKWIKASITGTIWAASEIVLGSFLHNLKVPFSGNILTAIGIVILISISYRWTEKGLFWRAGLICALMKTMSPSTVIFGPMIAIFTEAVLLELFARLLGRTIAGYVVGSMMAMSWNLLQKILNYIIFYGSNIIEVYTNLLKLAQKQLDIQTDIVWLPIIILLIVYALFGLLAAVTGIRVGRKMISQPDSPPPEIINNQINKVTPTTTVDFHYSIIWLFLNTALMIGSFIILNITTWYVWSITISAIIIMWSFRYKRALRQISKPKFWIFFIIITLITAFVFTKVESGDNLIQQGLLTGLKMNFRAAIIIVGFSVLGTELYNPVLRNFFQRTTFKNLPMALELSVESLPSFIANIPDLKSLVKNPVSIFYQVISQADKRLSIIKKTLLAQRVFIISGSLGEGKTTYAKKLIEVLRTRNIKVAGFLSEKIRTDDSHIIGYDLVNLETQEKEVFLRENAEYGFDAIGRFTISAKGLEFGNFVLRKLISTENRIIVIDEVGSLELRNNGWAECLNNLIEKSENYILIIVRDIYLREVMNKWNLNDAKVFNIHETNYQDTALSIIEATN
jgi:nucleoside-triphosphatase THEP1